MKLPSRYALVFGALSLVVCAPSQRRPDTPTSILQSPGDSVRIRLVDAITAQPIATAPVSLASDNGIRCVKAPCPTDGKEWMGVTDAHGSVTIPKSALNSVANVTSAEHHGDVVNDASRDAKGEWTVELFPEEAGDPGPRPLKLIDAKTAQPIANADVRIETRIAGSATTFVSAKSNALGWVLVPFELLAKGADDSWVVAPGYDAAHIDFAYARRRMELHRP